MSLSKTQPVGNLGQLVGSIPIRRSLPDPNKRDEFEWSQWQSATKAINNTESPAKEKHIRNLSYGTLQLEGARLFWSMMTRIHIESHPIVCWKFCYVIHRLLREGHKHVINDSLVLMSFFEQLRKYWSGLQHNYGLLAYRYCYLLTSKLQFHERNPTFAGDLTLGDHTDLRRLFNENFDSNLRLCTDLMDYMNELLSLVQAVFTSLDQSRANSMTSTGQCRLHPLVVCIQDSSVLYDYIVKILFQLHEGLPGNSLQEQRERLFDQFRRLKSFYNQSSKMQYFTNLIKVPRLPENLPNFKIKEELRNHQTPVAVVQSSAEGILVDLSTDLSKSSVSQGHGSKEISVLEQRLTQVETEKFHRKGILDFIDDQSDAMLQQSRSETDDLHRTIAVKDAELLAERNRRAQIEEQLQHQSNQQQHLEEIRSLETKTYSDEKSQKLLDTYNKLNQEHTLVLRQQSDLQKQCLDLKQELVQLKEQSQKKQTEVYENNEKLTSEIIQLRQTNDELQARIQSMSNERNDYEILTRTTSERMKEIEQAKDSVEQRLKEFEHAKVSTEKEKSTCERKLKETEGVRRNLIDQNREHEEDLIDLLYEKEKLEEKVLDLEQIVREWAQKFIDMADKQKLIQSNHDNLVVNLKRQYKHSTLTYCINQIHQATEQTKDSRSNNDQTHLRAELQIALTSMKAIQELAKKQTDTDENATLSFLHECTRLSHCVINIIRDGQGNIQLVQDREQATRLANQCRDAGLDCINLFTQYQAGSSSMDSDQQSAALLHRLNSLVVMVNST